MCSFPVRMLRLHAMTDQTTDKTRKGVIDQFVSPYEEVAAATTLLV